MFQVNNQQIFAKSHQPEKETKKEAKPIIKSLKCDKIFFFIFILLSLDTLCSTRKNWFIFVV